MSIIRVMLVDDLVVVRIGIRLVLESMPDLRVCAEASSGKEACQLYAEFRPDVVVMDVSLPEVDGIGATERILTQDPRARILILSAQEDSVTPKYALAAGACGYLSKRGTPEALIEAIRQVAQGGNYLDPRIAQQMVLAELSGVADPINSLSGREFQIFKLIAIGKSVAEIARVLCVSSSTVGTHLYHIKHKLGISNGVELAMLAVRTGLVEIHSSNKGNEVKGRHKKRSSSQLSSTDIF